VTRIARALAVAAAIWGGANFATPSGLPDVVQRSLAPGRLGEARFPHTIAIDARPLSWDQLCMAVAHEWGHLVGRGHSSNPNSIMFWRFHRDPRCTRWRAFLRWSEWNSRLEPWKFSATS